MHFSLIFYQIYSKMCLYACAKLLRASQNWCQIVQQWVQKWDVKRHFAIFTPFRVFVIVPLHGKS